MFASSSLLSTLSASKPPPVAVIPDEYLISPITGEKIQASKMQEHMRIGLLDPRWLEQRDRSIRERQIEDEVYAPGQDIQSSLKQLAERRTDIFGVEETAIGKKIGEEEIQKPEEKVSEVIVIYFFCNFLRKGGNCTNVLSQSVTSYKVFRLISFTGYLGWSLWKHGTYAAGSPG